MVKRKSIPRKKPRKTKKVKKSSSTKSKGTAKVPSRQLMKVGANSAHHAVRVAPFSSATSQPKIPDGLFTSSLSRRLQQVTEIQNSNGGDMGNTDMWCIFSPTLGIPLTVLNSEDGLSKRPNSSENPQYVGCPGQSVTIKLEQFGTGTVWPPVDATDYTVFNDSGFAQWRIVSQGLRLELLNTDEENDGWFEAFRFNWRAQCEDLCLTPLNGSTGPSKQLGCAVNPTELKPYLETISAVEQPGYQTGLLRDLKKFEFMLHPQSTTHDPVVLKDTYSITNNISEALASGAFYSPYTETLNLKGGDPIAQQIMDGLVDMNMDWLCIKLHCRVNNNTSANNGSKFICNVMQNVEFAAAPGSDLATFQSVNKHDPKSAKVTDSLNNDPKSVNMRRE